MKRTALVVGHADADGHIIADQLRRQLSAIPSFQVTVRVDPKLTEGHRAWTRLHKVIPDDENYDIVFFADLMFAPKSFHDEADSLVSFAQSRRGTRFYVLDHHPLPLQRLQRAQNIRAVYRDDVVDCSLGGSTEAPSWEMVVAALCEKQPTRVMSASNHRQRMVAKGMRRAAALGGTLNGPMLMAIVGAGEWDEIAALGEEDNSLHHLPRGRRPSDSTSAQLEKLRALAQRLVLSTAHAKGTVMPYDGPSEATPTSPKIAAAPPRDLEAIVSLLELAALSLTDKPGARFTEEQLIEEAQSIAGDEFTVLAWDVKLVIGKSGFLKKIGREFTLK
jgi:hypothetical protein